MPLIIITGTPCSGKTFRAQQIASALKSRLEAEDSSRQVIYIPSHHASLDPSAKGSSTSGSVSDNHHISIDHEDAPRTSHQVIPTTSPRELIYDSARLEKTARAEEFSATKRALSKQNIVISDSPNYIKGFRYQLYCEAKATGTRSIVIHTAAREDECQAWNTARLEAWGWDTTDSEAPQVKTIVGKDVLGDLQPESHTAVYGDTVTRSRSSSMDGQEVQIPTQAEGQGQAEDTMTLKSLYISGNEPQKQTVTPMAVISETKFEMPATRPPDPKDSVPYTPRAFRSLFMRYEPPSPFTRWDTPLFIVPSGDEHPPYDEIYAALFPVVAKPTSKKALLAEKHERERKEMQVETEIGKVEDVKQNAATVLPSASAPNALQILESTTGDVVKAVLLAARDAGVADVGEGREIEVVVKMVDGEEKFLVEVPEGVGLSQPGLQRLRRKFTQIQKGGIAHGQGYTSGRRNVAEAFVRFLGAEWEET